MKKRVAFEQIKELICRFPITIAFFHWLGGEHLIIRPIAEKRNETRLESVGGYYIGDLKIFYGDCQFYLDHLKDSFKENVVEENYHSSKLLKEFLKVEKKQLPSFSSLLTTTVSLSSSLKDGCMGVVGKSLI